MLRVSLREAVGHPFVVDGWVKVGSIEIGGNAAGGRCRSARGQSVGFNAFADSDRDTPAIKQIVNPSQNPPPVLMSGSPPFRSCVVFVRIVFPWQPNGELVYAARARVEVIIAQKRYQKNATGRDAEAVCRHTSITHCFELIFEVGRQVGDGLGRIGGEAEQVARQPLGDGIFAEVLADAQGVQNEAASAEAEHADR